MRWFLLMFFISFSFTYAGNPKMLKKLPSLKKPPSVLKRNPTIQESAVVRDHYLITEFVTKLLEMGYRSENGSQYPLTVIEVPSKTKQILSSNYYFPEEVTLVVEGNRQVLQYELISTHSQVLDLCPTKDMDKKNISKLSKYYQGMEFCLSAKKFTPQERKECDNEIQPVLVKKVFGDHSIGEKCGRNSAGFLLAFAYVFCEVSVLDSFLELTQRSHISQPSGELFPDNPPIIEVYELCVIPSSTIVASKPTQQFDELSRPNTIYTRHRIVPNTLRHEDEIADQAHNFNIPVENVHENTSPSQNNAKQSNIQFYHENLEKFKIMKAAFKVRKGVKYVPQMLIPTEDMAFPLQKKATYTYFNIHALWNELIPIMHLVNHRIRQLALENNRELSIYTRIFALKLKGYEIKYLGNSQIIIPNIWSKIVHDTLNNFATTVIIHNTPYLPVQTERLCTKSELVRCNFENWWPENTLLSKQEIQLGAKYAYCCQVTEKIKQIYGITMNFKKPIVDLAYDTTDKDDNSGGIQAIRNAEPE